jgi:transposase-like protein
MFEGMNIIDFGKRFQSNADCLQYLLDIKWANGFKCSKCSSLKCWKGKQWTNLRCQDCGYEESATAGTLFHKVKFPLLKAFYICYQVCVSKKGVSSCELSRELTLRQKTCWSFKRKIQAAMQSSQKHALTGRVDVDEIAIGGHDEQSPGRSKGDKKLVCLAVEIREDKKMGRAYGTVIDNYGSEELRKIFDAHISKEKALVRTDQWTGYTPLESEYTIERIISDKGKNFPEIHILIMNLKSWLRGIYHKCSEKHMQAYLNEFFYRFNRRSFGKTCFHKLIVTMVQMKPLFLKEFTT